MKRLLAIGTFFVLVSCSNTEESIVEDQGCFSNGTKNYKWTMVTTWPKNFPGLGMGPENFSKYVNEMTCGRMQIKVYGAGEFVPALGVFDAVSQGNVQLGHGASYYWTGKVKSSQFFTAVPFGLTAQEMNGWLHYGGGMELWEEAYEPFNLIPLAGGNSGVQMAGWFKKEINTLSDLKGLKMRIPGLAGEVFTRAGAETVTLPGNEIFLSLQQGVVDAAADRTVEVDGVEAQQLRKDRAGGEPALIIGRRRRLRAARGQIEIAVVAEAVAEDDQAIIGLGRGRTGEGAGGKRQGRGGGAVEIA